MDQEDQGKNKLRQALIQGGAALAIVHIVGAVGTRSWWPIVLLAAWAIGIGIAVRFKKLLDAESK